MTEEEEEEEIYNSKEFIEECKRQDNQIRERLLDKSLKSLSSQRIFEIAPKLESCYLFNHNSNHYLLLNTPGYIIEKIKNEKKKIKQLLVVWLVSASQL